MFIFTSFIKFGKFWALFLQMIYLFLFLLLLGLPWCVCLFTLWCPTGPLGSVHCFFLGSVHFSLTIFLSVPHLMISTSLFSCLRIPLPTAQICFCFPTVNFSFHDCTFQPQHLFLVLFHVFSLLIFPFIHTLFSKLWPYLILAFWASPKQLF